MKIVTAHPSGAAPLPWQNPWNLISIVPPAIFLESPYAVVRKYLISSIADSIDSTASRGTPKVWRTSDAIACAMLSYQFAASIDLSAAEVLDCQKMSYRTTFSREQSSAGLPFSLYISFGMNPWLLTTSRIRFPNIYLYEAFESAFINEKVWSFSIMVTPGLFSNITERPLDQQYRANLRFNAIVVLRAS